MPDHDDAMAAAIRELAKQAALENEKRARLVRAMAVYRPASAAVRARLRSTIASFAESNGESNPTNLRTFETDSWSAQAVLAPGAIDNQDPSPIYVVVANGHFVGMSAPPGVPPPTGTALYMLIESGGSFACVGWGIRRSNPNLRKLGTIQKL
jgi:hypothetical protein